MHSVNPINLRLGVSKYWRSSWATSSIKNSYSYMVNQDYFIQTFYWTLFNKKYGYLGEIFKDVLPAGINIVRSFKTVNIFCEFYYVQPKINKYLLFYYFNKFFSIDSFKYLAEKRKISLSKNDLSLISSFKPIFLKWIGKVVVAKVEKKFWSSFKQVLTLIFSRLLHNPAALKVYVKPIDNQLVSADFLSRFISTKLQQGVKVRSLLSNIQNSLNQLVEDKALLGFYIKLSGRFSRVQQASCSVYNSGVLARNEISTNLDYSFRTANLKFSVCGVKVLLARPLDSVSGVVSNQSLNIERWYRYIPQEQYSRWQRGKLASMLSENANNRNLVVSNKYF